MLDAEIGLLQYLGKVLALRPPRPPWRMDKWLAVPGVVCLITAATGQAFTWGGAQLGIITSPTTRITTVLLGLGLMVLSFFVVIGGDSGTGREQGETRHTKTVAGKTEDPSETLLHRDRAPYFEDKIMDAVASVLTGPLAETELTTEGPTTAPYDALLRRGTASTAVVFLGLRGANLKLFHDALQRLPPGRSLLWVQPEIGQAMMREASKANQWGLVVEPVQWSSDADNEALSEALMRLLAP